MSDDSFPSLTNSNSRSATPPSPLLGHFEAEPEQEWDISSAFGLSDIQVRAIELTAQGLSDSKIAETLHLDRKTLWRWKAQDSQYRKALGELRVELHAAIVDRYRTLLLESMDALAEYLHNHFEERRFRAAYALMMMAGNFKTAAAMLPEQTPPPRPPEPVLPYKMG